MAAQNVKAYCVKASQYGDYFWLFTVKCQTLKGGLGMSLAQEGTVDSLA